MHKHTCIHTVAGVLYVHIHSAADLVSADSDGFSDPYCIVLANKKKVKEIIFPQANFDFELHVFYRC